MPGNKMMIDVNLPSFERKGNLEERVNELHSYVYQLMESLRYALNNLDTTNFNSTELSKFTGEITEPIYVRLKDDEGKVAEIKATADEVESRIFDEDGDISNILQKADGIKLSVEHDETGKISYIKLKSGEVEIAGSDIIDLRGTVTFEDLSSTGETEINGANIRTGTINAGSVNVINAFKVFAPDGSTVGEMGFGQGSTHDETTDGMKVEGPDPNIYLFVSEAGIRMQAYKGTRFYLTGEGEIVASKSINQTSDRNLKKEIEYDLDRYSGFFKALLPCTFRLKSEENGKRYLGFIAQEVREALEKNGLSAKDFAGLSKVKEEDGEEHYVLGYTEFIALLTNELQKTQRKQDELIKRIEKLEQM